MKNFITHKLNTSCQVTFTVFVLFIASLTSCDDFVEITPKGPVADNYFNNPEDYDKALIGAYDMLQTTYINVFVASIAGDDVIAGGDPAVYDQPTLQRVDKMLHTPADNNQLSDIWGFMYAAMNRAN